MWLRRLVGVMIILAFVVMNTMTVWGLAAPKKVQVAAVDASQVSQATLIPPKIDFTVDPPEVGVGSSSALKWAVTGNSPVCNATSSLPGPWNGPKTQYGAESTGKLTTVGEVSYTITCKDNGGTTVSKATIKVTKTPSATASSAGATQATSSSTSNSGGKTYCGGRTPCYGPRDVAAHGGSGNCWGWNVDQVFNITSLDKSYHKTKSGVSSIEVASVCGKDLAPALNGSASAGGQTRNHLQSTKVNASANTSPYFVGFFDSSK